MNIVLIDDDASVRENLKIILSLYVPDARVIAEADGVQAGLTCLKNNKPDLLLLDVEMQDGTGFDLLAMYKDLDFKVIFVTGHDAYAIKAFKYSAIDYILKPVDTDLLVSAIERARNEFNSNEEQIKVDNLMKNRQGKDDDQKILLKDAESVYLVNIKDIVRCESETNYTMFYLSDCRKLTISKTLKEFENILEDQNFFRSHQSHLINLKYFDHYAKREGGIIHMKDKSTVPLAVRKKDQLMAILQNME